MRLRIHYTSPYFIVLPEKYVETSDNSYVITAADLPTPTKKGFEFEAWYYDTLQSEISRALGRKITVTSSPDVQPEKEEEKTSKLKQFLDFDYRIPITDDRKAFIVDESNYAISDAEGDPENGKVTLDDPNTGSLLKLDAKDILTVERFSARELIETIDSFVEKVSGYVNVHDNAY